MLMGLQYVFCCAVDSIDSNKSIKKDKYLNMIQVTLVQIKDTTS